MPSNEAAVAAHGIGDDSSETSKLRCESKKVAVAKAQKVNSGH